MLSVIICLPPKLSISLISSILSLEVTQEQKEAIYHLFAHNDWEFKEVQISPNNDQSRDDSGDGDYFIEQDDNIVSHIWALNPFCDRYIFSS
jgi:hypothetical protein